MRKSIDDRYFDELIDMIGGNTDHSEYRSLLYILNNIIFKPTLEDDKNRVADGLQLRHDLGCEFEWDATVLEVLIAMANREEQDVLTDNGMTNWTSILFWTMIENLGLIDQTDDMIDQGYVEDRIHVFMYRMYRENGEGGCIFKREPGCKFNYKRRPFWMIMQWYVTENLI